MLYRWLFILRKPSNRLWLAPAYSAIFAILFAFAAHLADTFLPPHILPEIHLEVVENLLNIISTSMLAVSTFSLSIIVSAVASASSGATPRATDLVVNDGASRRTIASFISALIYAIIAKTALGLELYALNGRFIIFISTIAILLYVIMRLIAWVYTLSQLGRMGNTLDKIYQSAEQSLLNYRQSPQLGATWQSKVGLQACQLLANDTGYLIHINMNKLQSLAEKSNTYLHIKVRTGELIMPNTVLAEIDNIADNENDFRQAFVLDKQRTFQQDPRWGLIVFSEVAQRALSPAVNDPGTAIIVMTKVMKLLIQSPEEKSEPEFNRLSINALNCQDFISDCFAPIIRDGGAILEVHLNMQKVLAGIWQNAPETELREYAQIAAKDYLQRAKTTLPFEQDFLQLKQKHDSLFTQ
ncbi:DUF2254 domain-containing protein [Lonepinella sp. BR2474]|uniref:DUF2254 domain-containing protein n=1 Tax=Lonepinella sp. BR2474 TaxID=3434548 RepID=UPI003F6E258D